MNNFVNFSDAFKAGYKAVCVNNVNSENDVLINKNNLKLERLKTDYKVFNDYILTSINGYYHMSDTDNINGVMVLDAVKTLKISDQNQIGLTSFRKIGKIKKIKIDNSKVSTYSDGSVKLLIDEDLTNKTVILSIAGYLTFQDNNCLTIINDNLFKIDFNKFNLLDRYYECKKYIDLSSLPLEFSILNNQLVSSEQIKSDENLRAILQLSQSFIIIIDSPSLVLEKQHIKKTGMPGMYISYTLPQYPLFNNLGRINEYWYTKEDGQYSVNVYDNLVENRIYNTLIKDSLINITNYRRPDLPTQFADCYYLKISKP